MLMLMRPGDILKTNGCGEVHQHLLDQPKLEYFIFDFQIGHIEIWKVEIFLVFIGNFDDIRLIDEKQDYYCS